MTLVAESAHTKYGSTVLWRQSLRKARANHDRDWLASLSGRHLKLNNINATHTNQSPFFLSNLRKRMSISYTVTVYTATIKVHYKTRHCINRLARRIKHKIDIFCSSDITIVISKMQRLHWNSHDKYRTDYSYLYQKYNHLIKNFNLIQPTTSTTASQKY